MKEKSDLINKTLNIKLKDKLKLVQNLVQINKLNFYIKLVFKKYKYI